MDQDKSESIRETIMEGLLARYNIDMATRKYKKENMQTKIANIV